MTAYTDEVDLFLWCGQSFFRLPLTNPVPDIVMAATPDVASENCSSSGTSWAQRSARAAQNVDRHMQDTTGHIYVIDAGGHTDLRLDLTAEQAIANAEAYWQGRIDYAASLTPARPISIVACTLTDSTLFDPTQQGRRTTLNGYIRASSLLAAVVDWVDLDAPPANDPGDLNDASDPTYFSDGTHFTEDEGAPEAAGQVLIVMDALRNT